MSILVLLCAGVLLAASTWSAFAAIVTVKAVVPAPPLTEPAVITSPAGDEQTTTQLLSVQGTCPDNSYVTLSDNGLLAGVVTCSSGAFTISLDLSPGSNELQAQDYNITNDAGPVSSPVVITYTPQNTGNSSSTSGGQIAVPTQLLVIQVDKNTPYISSKTALTVSSRPTLAGVAPPGSMVSIAVDSTSPACEATANEQGYWVCRLPHALSPDVHTVHVSATTPQGAALTFPGFIIRVTAGGSQATPALAPFRITTTYVYRVNLVNQLVSYRLHLSGGLEPYAFTINWGDSTTQTILRQNSDDFTISHTYTKLRVANATRTIKIQAVDASGQASTLELQALLRNPAFPAAASTNNSSSGLARIFNAVRPWLWLLWPGYTIVVLMVFSFWLGERQEIAILRAARQIKPKRPRHTHVHH